MIQSWHSGSKRGGKVMENLSHVSTRSIPWDAIIPSSDPVVITVMIASYRVNRIYMDGDSSVDIMYEHYFNKLPEHIRSCLCPPTTPLIGFSGYRSYPEGVVDLALTIGSHPLSRTIMLPFYVVKSTSTYNVILGRYVIHKLSMEVSTIRSVVEFVTIARITTVKSDYPGRDASLAAAIKEGNTRDHVGTYSWGHSQGQESRHQP
ncbi:hypothetical protein Tco_0345515 [Tanacetum coccineum]